MKLSVIIPYMNDLDVLQVILPALLKECKLGECEVIIIDNGSYLQLVYPDDRVRIVRKQSNIGVGGAFNQGVELAKADKIVIMGSDVIPQDGWFDRVISTLDNSTATIYNCVSSGFNDLKEPFGPSRIMRYGANLLYLVTKDDLPANSVLQNDPKYSNILQAKWRYQPPSTDEFLPVECLLGAFYWMHKSDYEKIHGWNGHRMWGSLEPMFSIKARAHGIKLLVDTKLEAAHHYGRAPVDRPSREDLRFYNMLFMAHTMFSDALRDELIEHLRYGGREEKLEKLNVNVARLMIKRAHGLVQVERDYNNRHFKHGLIKNWNKFNRI